MIRAEREGDLALVRIDRPEKRNALTLAMIESLRDALLDAGADPAVRGVLVCGTPPSTCAGVDLAEFAGGTPDGILRLIDALGDACAAARRCPKPVAMAIQGHCFGGALELACACDFRVAAPGALLAMPEVALGIPSVIDAALIERHVGAGRARELILTAEPVAAGEALAWGLVNRVAPADRLLDACRELLGAVVRHDPAAIGRQKRLFSDWDNLPLDEAIQHSKEALVASFAGGVPQRLAQERMRSR
ncbi:MAG: enoyl-CoA hydratase/isomerase family protein [Chloroflexi bacterium]|nr:MAG: enoyl-CoA hydratase/isomerase family protein [Chloroflexota bacterium]